MGRSEKRSREEAAAHFNISERLGCHGSGEPKPAHHGAALCTRFMPQMLNPLAVFADSAMVGGSAKFSPNPIETRRLCPIIVVLRRQTWHWSCFPAEV